jgi:hypothetical protein
MKSSSKITDYITCKMNMRLIQIWFTFDNLKESKYELTFIWRNALNCCVHRIDYEAWHNWKFIFKNWLKSVWYFKCRRQNTGRYVKITDIVLFWVFKCLIGYANVLLTMFPFRIQRSHNQYNPYNQNDSWYVSNMLSSKRLLKCSAVMQ